MNSNKIEKKIDCIKMKREIQAAIYKETKDMTAEEISAYFNKKSQNSALWHRLVNRNKIN